MINEVSTNALFDELEKIAKSSPMIDVVHVDDSMTLGKDREKLRNYARNMQWVYELHHGKKIRKFSLIGSDGTLTRTRPGFFRKMLRIPAKLTWEPHKKA